MSGPVSSKALPVIVYEIAPSTNVMPAIAKILLVSESVRVLLDEAFVPLNMSEFPLTGADPPQFAPVTQSVLLTDPVQMLGAARARGLKPNTASTARPPADTRNIIFGINRLHSARADGADRFNKRRKGERIGFIYDRNEGRNLADHYACWG